MNGIPVRPSAFVRHLLRLNGMPAGEFAAWELRPGMRFGEPEAWWRDGALRDAPHEGLDLVRFRLQDGCGVALGPGARVPVLWAGRVVAVVPDFLGRSVFVAHGRCDGEGRRLHSVYGHLEPRAELAPGSALRGGGEVGAIADPPARRSRVPAHLHLTLALVRDGGTASPLDWAALRDPARARLIDPLPLVCGTMRPPAGRTADNTARGRHGS